MTSCLISFRSLFFHLFSFRPRPRPLSARCFPRRSPVNQTRRAACGGCLLGVFFPLMRFVIPQVAHPLGAWTEEASVTAAFSDASAIYMDLLSRDTLRIGSLKKFFWMKQPCHRLRIKNAPWWLAAVDISTSSMLADGGGLWLFDAVRTGWILMIESWDRLTIGRAGVRAGHWYCC